MRRLLAVVAMLVLAACSRHVEEPDHQSEWRQVLEQKRAAAAAEASHAQKQVYADSLASFVRRYPGHSRAREVYHRIQLEFADELLALGRYQDAIRFYKAVLEHHPENEDAQNGLAAATDRLAVSQEKLEHLEKGMSRRQVTSLLGKPLPGWTRKHSRRDMTIEAWYYRTASGGIAAVYFRDGKVFAAETNSEAPLGL